MSPRFGLGVLALALAVVLAPPADAQRRRGARAETDERRDAPAVLAALAPTCRAAARSTATVRVGARDVALATVVHPHGYLLTKASEVETALDAAEAAGEDVTLLVRLPDARVLATELRLVDERYDLALLRVEAGGLAPVRWADADPRVGDVVVPCGADGRPLSVGLVGVAARPIAGGDGYLGVSLGDADGGGVEVVRVLAGTPAQAAGVSAGDILLAVGDTSVSRRDEAVDAIRAHRAGAQLVLELLRAGERVRVAATLAARAESREDRRGRGERLEGERNARRDGFPTALQHDAVLDPSACGGPLVGLDGAVVGLNIARAGRVRSYALPAGALRSLVDELVASAERRR